MSNVKVTTVVVKHNRCLGAAEPRRSIASVQSFVKETLPQLLTVTNDTKPRDVIEAVQKHLKAPINYAAAHKVLLVLQWENINIEGTNFICYLPTLNFSAGVAPRVDIFSATKTTPHSFSGSFFVLRPERNNSLRVQPSSG
ncbi:hypothetical protein FN846DRAFT_895882 [Sphaerosporella brunnea]|uniref:Uncharacterized protein n=1 Tax=Sphaerosporella brunnea TaxID=1250544 RepID=A0A5J5EEE0_9PEZI|nr:hypothetical protein FN846DRAFT_895882 [Sphaerosporella brunnea]